MEQQSLWDGIETYRIPTSTQKRRKHPMQSVQTPVEEPVEVPQSREQTESKEAYEGRRAAEMAEKLGWPAIRLEPFKRFPGIIIDAGFPAWSAILKDATDSAIGLLLLPLHRQLNPLTLESIDEKTGLYHYPVEVISQVEERRRRQMIELAEALDWPRISYWAANRTQVVGPGRSVWQKYYLHSCCGLVADVVGALERRLRGEPEKTHRRYREYDDGE